MQCENHREREAAAICVSCGKPLCEECDRMFQGKHYCENCAKDFSRRAPKEGHVYRQQDINGFLWFIFSLMPGAGHMYMGLMKRGVMLLGIFLGVVALDNLIFGWRIASAIGVLIYVYAFFDSYPPRGLERECLEDRDRQSQSLNLTVYYFYRGYWCSLIDRS